MPTTGCALPPINPSCSDPAYRAAHPDECENFPLLILIPEYSLVEPGNTVAYRVLLRANGLEIEVDQGLIWNSSNLGVAVISDEGIATGVTEGISAISVTWQDLSANAQLEVVESCQETNQHFAILIDNSKSMGQAFSAAYATKLSFSKQTASAFLETINTSKDDFSVWEFSAAPSLQYDWGTDVDEAQAEVASISGTNERTNLTEAITEAVASFPSDGSTRVLVIFTDFEWTGVDPHEVCAQFKDSGGFIVVVATRAWGEFFQDAAECASGGFLLSAYEDVEGEIITNLSGLKNFICNSGCNDEIQTAPMAELNYTDFLQWDVTSGRVDLIGLGIWDVRPGHGLAVDMQGSGDAGFPPPGQNFGLGQLTTKENINFVDGVDYRFSLNVSGSLALSPPDRPGTWTIRIRVGNGVDEEITITNGGQDYENNDFEWTQSGDFSGSIIIEQTNIGSAHRNVGIIIDDILLEDVTNTAVLFEDDFNSENPTEIPVNHGYYGVCIDLGAQTADPEPPTPRVSE